PSRDIGFRLLPKLEKSDTLVHAHAAAFAPELHDSDTRECRREIATELLNRSGVIAILRRAPVAPLIEKFSATDLCARSDHATLAHECLDGAGESVELLNHFERTRGLRQVPLRTQTIEPVERPI